MLALARGRLGAVVPAATRALRRTFAAAAQPEFLHEDLFQSTGALPHSYRLLTSDHVSTFDVRGKTMLAVEPEALRLISAQVRAPSSSPEGPARPSNHPSDPAWLPHRR